MRFSDRERRDLLVAWLALGLAFALFFQRVSPANLLAFLTSRAFVGAMLLSLLTVGVGFLLHELAHKVVAVRYGQHAEFRADYTFLALAVAGGLAGFIFAAPGAVYHRGRLTAAQHGHIALAGPVTNLALAVAFAPLWFVTPLLAQRGVQINLLLAGFNMLPIGGLDGKTVKRWSIPVYLAVAVPSMLLAISAIFI
ncbi:zinc metalloprotease [Halanaeroarchaeum sulfurireducens]|uniref:Metallopeptidase n=1 Tax=Halanaeroarchaeum sulfurireducens TaxID=1604004 RepID=A0A0F7PA14_9EURY|nr:metalloprotease [Halanaeroarchaeum sulfurireducens]AKH97991.1 metallopeptidase [Halanaeroarchaeum sulfurireducens]ALG82385.1 metallopeptidase [Halanaeroarchaeum sulfurireducens]